MPEDIEYNFEIKRHLATLSTSSNGKITLELNIVSFRGEAAKLDIRRWFKPEPRPMNGIYLTDAEAETLLEALTDYFNRKENGNNENKKD